MKTIVMIIVINLLVGCQCMDTGTDTDADTNPECCSKSCGLLYQMFVEGSIAQGRAVDVQDYLDNYCEEVTP